MCAEEIQVTTLAQVRQVEHSARRLAGSIGFPTRDCDEIALAAVELALNLVKHAGGGTIAVTKTGELDRIGIQIESKDTGPGIEDFENALSDGHSTAGGLGVGLGTVNRLMDSLELRPMTSVGSHIVCRRWLRPESRVLCARCLEIGAATRARRFQKENGDAFIAHQWNGSALAGVIDGLGHGPMALRAAQAARNYVRQHCDQSLEDIFQATGRACRATRGVVMALARFDFPQKALRIASVGNIEVRVRGGESPFRMVVQRGVVGLNAPRAATTLVPWTPASLMVMHSDGVRAHWKWPDLPGLARDSAQETAQQLLSRFGSSDDDATVLVIKGLSS